MAVKAKKRKPVRRKAKAGKTATKKSGLWRKLFRLSMLFIGLAIGLAIPWMVWLDMQVRDEFEGRIWDVPSRVYARPLSIYNEKPLSRDALLIELKAAGYRKRNQTTEPGSYSASGNSYDYGEYIMGVVSYYNTEEDDLDGWGKMEGTMDIGIAYSRGGYCWHENFPTERFMNFSGKGNWDGQMIIPASHIILNDDEMRFYYAGCDHTHKPPYGNQELSIGAASLRPDGFVYIEAGDDTAELFTRIFAITEPGFEINADASGGEISVELCDGEGQPIPGFEMENFISVKKDGLRIPLEWKNDPNQVVLLNTRLRLKVRAKNAKIYSITMINGETNPKYWKFRDIDYADILWKRSPHSE